MPSDQLNPTQIDKAIERARALIEHLGPRLDQELVGLGDGGPWQSGRELMVSDCRAVCIKAANTDGVISIQEAKAYAELCGGIADDRIAGTTLPVIAQADMRSRLEQDETLQGKTWPSLRSVELLRQIDAKTKSHDADDWIRLLVWFGELMALSDGAVSRRQMEELSRLASWATPSSKNLGRSEAAITPEIPETIELIHEILELTEPAIWEAASRFNVKLPMAPRKAVLQEFFLMAVRVSLSDPTGLEKELAAIRQIFRTIRPDDTDWFFDRDLKSEVLPRLRAEAARQGSVLCPGTSWTSAVLGVLQLTDRAKGTAFQARYSAALFRVGNLVARISGDISEAESQELRRYVHGAPGFSPGDLSLREDRVAKKMEKSAGSPIAAPSTSSGEIFEQALQELSELIGLATVKEEVLRLVSFIKVQAMRREHGLKDSDLTLHAVFSGNPGTGKTTVARLIAQIYKSLGVLSSGHLVETDRAGLVAGYVGQTALKTEEVVNSAKGGVLFIDEAYSLTRSNGDSHDFGAEALEALLKRMEDLREDLVVIVAGYSNEMEDFIRANPGLSSRFARRIVFPDYSPGELLKIFRLYCQQQDYVLSPSAEKSVITRIAHGYVSRDKFFGNARYVRNLFEEIIANQAQRVVSTPMVTRQELQTIEGCDVPTE